MKKLLMALLLFGCAMLGCTSTETAGEHARRLWLENDLQMRALVDDWDTFWLADRSSHLSRWNTRMGY